DSIVMAGRKLVPGKPLVLLRKTDCERDRHSDRLFIERDNFDLIDPQEPRQRDLSTAIPPDLSHHTRGNSNLEALRQSPTQQCDQSLVTTIQGDQSAGIQRYPPTRRGSMRSAHLMSSAVGSPCCSIRSRRSVRRESRFSCSARTLAI